jgi:hypothetical protein
MKIEIIQLFRKNSEKMNYLSARYDGGNNGGDNGATYSQHPPFIITDHHYQIVEPLSQAVYLGFEIPSLGVYLGFEILFRGFELGR